MTITQIESTTFERLPVVIHTTADPTAALPEFALTTEGEGDPAGYEAGRWDSDGWDSETGRIVAWSALVGDGQALDISSGVTYALRVRWTVDGQAPAKTAGHFSVV